jgi:hypothetical protein
MAFSHAQTRRPSFEETVPVDTNSQEFRLLLRQFTKGQVVLFAGAGFSLDARTQRGEQPPHARALAERIAAECGWPYDGEDLTTVYAQAERHLGSSALRSFLRLLYGDLAPAGWHYDVAKLCWYRIYTTNIDDVLERTYLQRAAQSLVPIICPASHEDTDQWYASVQCVHLHGYVHDDKPLTFTFDAYAGQTAATNSWYQQLVEDMQSKSVVFVGTRLAEPPFYHYLKLRTERPSGKREFRAKCFVVAPQSSPIRRRELEDQGYAVIDATAAEFFSILVPLAQAIVSGPLDIVRARYPHMIAAIEAGVLADHSELLRQFDMVGVIETGAEPVPRSSFLLGAEPTWTDIVYNIDARRGISQRMQDALLGAPTGVSVYALIGPAGSGKSTCMRRVAYELTRAGNTVYFAKGLQKFSVRPLVALAEGLGTKRVYVFIDDAFVHLERLNDVIGAVGNANLTFVIADQSHLLAPRLKHIKAKQWQVERMPVLDQGDCEAILETLDEFGLLGVLTGQPKVTQMNAFLIRSRKQLLVAMKEATSGQGFNVIIAQEYGSLASDSAKLAYVIACLVHTYGPAVRRRHLMACLDGTDYEKALVLNEQLVDVIVGRHSTDEYLIPRHRVIARQVVTETAPRALIREAILRIIPVIAGEITPQNISRRTLEYQAFRGILRFDHMRNLFGDDYHQIDSIYNELKPYCDQNFLYWLQRGRLEVHFDKFDTAQNYLNSSLAIRDNYQAWHYIGVLNLKRAAVEREAAVAQELAERGEAILRQQILERPDDAYPYAALIDHKLRYVAAHPGSRPHLVVRELYLLAQEAMKRHSFDEYVRITHDQAWKATLAFPFPVESQAKA